MRRLDIDNAATCEDLASAVYERVQQITRGKARRAARFLTAITCLEMEGVILPASPWCLLILFSLQDLAHYAPAEILVIDDWAFHHRRLGLQMGEADCHQITTAIVWAGRLLGNIEIRAGRTAVVRMRMPLAAAHCGAPTATVNSSDARREQCLAGG